MGEIYTGDDETQNWVPGFQDVATGPNQSMRTDVVHSTFLSVQGNNLPKLLTDERIWNPDLKAKGHCPIALQWSFPVLSEEAFCLSFPSFLSFPSLSSFLRQFTFHVTRNWND